MRKWIIVIIAALCLCIAALLRTVRPPAEEDGRPDWLRAYENFVLQEEYLDSGPKFESEIAPFASLHDLDKDGVPELSLTNGHTGRAGRCAYIYSYIDGKVEYLGVGPTDAFCVPDPAYPGLFGYFHIGGDSHSWTYYWKDGRDYGEERIYLMENGEYTEQSGNEELFALVQQKEKLVYLVRAPIDSIAETGWTAFAQEAGVWEEPQELEKS